MKRSWQALGVTLLVSSLSACAPEPLSCGPGLGPLGTVFTLYFGTAIPGRPDLTEKEWIAFVDHTITPTLPNGYTILDAKGAWMNPATHKTVSEKTKVLVVALPDEPGTLSAVNRIRTEYQTKFHQQLVGMTVEPACLTF